MLGKVSSGSRLKNANKYPVLFAIRHLTNQQSLPASFDRLRGIFDVKICVVNRFTALISNSDVRIGRAQVLTCLLVTV